MDFGAALVLFGLDLDLFQGIVTFLYDVDPRFRTLEGEDGSFRLELEMPAIETREDPFRMGVHLSGQLFLGTDPDPRVFDAWVRLVPEKVEGADGIPVGALRFEEVEEVIPAFAEAQVAQSFGPDGAIGEVLAAFEFPVFESLLRSAHEQLFGEGPELDPAAFETAFYLGHPAPIRRPLWDVGRVNGDWGPVLDLDVSYATKPALIAAVSRADTDPLPPEAPSIVRPGTGLGLVTTFSLIQANLDRQSNELQGSEIEGLTIDRVEFDAADWGFDIDGEGHKTGAEIDFAGSLVARFIGGTGGRVVLRSTVEIDVDTAWWVDVLSALAIVVPVAGWILGDVFIWEPQREAPGKVESALLDKFSTPLAAAAQQVASSFQIALIPTSAFLADVWFFDGNMAVAAAAFAGKAGTEVWSVSRDVAYLTTNPNDRRPSNRRKPVTSVADITLSSGHTLKPWQAGRMVQIGQLEIPGHHAVVNPKTTQGVYLRSNPDDRTSNNLLSD